MKKAYWLAPIAVLIAFIGLYISFQHDLEAAAQAEKDKKAAEARLKREETERKNKEALEKQRIATEKKKADEKEKAEREEAERKEEEELIYQRDRAQREAIRFARVVDDLKKDLESEKQGKELAEQIRESKIKDKQAALEFVAKAQANRKALSDLLVKIDEVEKARLAAEAAKAKKS